MERKEGSSPFHTVKILDTKQMRLIATGKNYSIFFKMIHINTYISIFNFAELSLEISI